MNITDYFDLSSVLAWAKLFSKSTICSVKTQTSKRKYTGIPASLSAATRPLLDRSKVAWNRGLPPFHATRPRPFKSCSPSLSSPMVLIFCRNSLQMSLSRPNAFMLFKNVLGIISKKESEFQREQSVANIKVCLSPHTTHTKTRQVLKCPCDKN